MTPRIAALALLAITACTEDVQLGADPDTPIPGLVSLAITPTASEVVVLDLAEPPHEVELTAIGTFVDGDTRDVTDEVSWSADRHLQGAFTAPGTFVTSNAAAGLVSIRARNGELSATATIAIDITVTVIDAAFPPGPGADELFTGTETTDPARSPSVVYPSDETMFPPDLAPVLFQLDQGAGNEVWRLVFESELLHLTVLTGGDRWQPDAAIAQLLAWSNAGGATSLTASAATSAEPGTIYASTPITLRYGAAAVGGVVSYRADGAGGIVAATLDGTTTAPLYPAESDGTCTGCHAISRDGRRLATSMGDEALRLLDLPSLDATSPMMRKMGSAAFSPDGRLVVVADKGRLRLLDADTGAPIGPDIPLGAGNHATHPDWDPGGDGIVVALGTSITNRDLKGGKIARLAYDAGAWGAPEILVDSTGDDDNNFYPRYAPDGSKIAYVHADAPARGAPSAELRMIDAAGGTPVVLARANGPATSMPTWAPGAGDVGWLAFTSTRAYGKVLAAGAEPKLWIAAVDLETDEAYAAFWLPAQDPTQRNYLPCWASAPTSTDP